MNKPHLPSGIYRHYKDKLYLVVDVARHSETEEWLVVYRPLYGDYFLTVRPYDMFVENVSVGEYNGPRFQLEQEL